MSRPRAGRFALSNMVPCADLASLDDLTLAQRCAAGDAAAQRAFYERERLQVHRTLYRVMGSNSQMEDLIQETFIEAFAAVGSFRGASTLHTWIDTIAARVCYRHLARPRSAPLADERDERSLCDYTERQADARTALRQLYAMLDRIEPKYRIAYTLHVIDGRPLAEVAKIARCSLMAVKNRVWRARQLVHARAHHDPVLRDFVLTSRPTP
jgi:RNA polymerase sigma-70 factor, ECF subfamily